MGKPVLRIGIDNISPGESTGRNAPGGMRLYLKALLSGFAAQAPHHEFVLFTPTWADSLLESVPPNVDIVRLPGVPISRTLRSLYQQTALVAASIRHCLDVFFATATVAPLLMTTPVVLAVQFLQFYEFPESFGRLRTAYLRLMVPLSLQRARKAIIFTEHSKRDLVHLTGVAEEKVCVVPHGLSEEVWASSKVPPSSPERIKGRALVGGRPYIIYVSSTYGYKNHLRLIRAFGILKQRMNVPHALLLIGSEVGVSFEMLRAEAESAGVRSDIVITGRLDQDVVASAYLGAEMAVFPTLYESFGYPAVEAMLCGCPLVASNIGSVRELAGNAAFLVDPYDEISLAEGMELVLSDASLRQSLVERGRERAREYTWERSARETLAILEQVGRR
jgi:glycosyltransferase involved in cell wall biosynthesis